MFAIIGDVHRFERPEKLVANIGLNPGQWESGRGKHIVVTVRMSGRAPAGIPQDPLSVPCMPG